MSPSKRHPRRKRGQGFSLETLDERQLLSAGMGSTFAILPGSVDKAGQISSIQFKIDPGEFTAGRGGKIVLGLDVAADPSGNIKPEIVSIKGASGRIATPLHHSLYSASIVKANKLGSPISSAVLATFRVPKAGQAPEVYTVQVQGAYGTTGKYLVGFYLPGDVTGTGTVTSADLQTIVSKLGATPTSSNYSFDADVNRDGKISLVDAKYASTNLGAKTMVSPIINVNLDPATDGPLHSRMTNFRTVHFTGSATPGASITFTEVNHNSPGATTKADATGNYSIMVPLGDGSNTFNVTSTDGFGQTITGQIAPVTYTTNPPRAINNPSQLNTSTG
jgi:hypothetical protein